MRSTNSEKKFRKLTKTWTSWIWINLNVYIFHLSIDLRNTKNGFLLRTSERMDWVYCLQEIQRVITNEEFFKKF